MTRIVHTADVHLDPDAPERLAAFETVLDGAIEREADAVTVGGDLFDSERAAERLRPRLRRLCTDRPFPILVLPGNHDVDAFGGNRFYGEDVRTMTDTPFSQVPVGDLLITTVPFVPTLDDDLLVALSDRDAHDGPEALLLHCSLNAPLDGSTGEEEAPRYCPVRPATLAELSFDFVLAGHYHDHHLRDLEGGTRFVYPGTPASVTRSEHGRRTVGLLDTTAADPLRLEYVETHHFDARSITVSPGTERATIERIEELTSAWDDRSVEGRILVDGFTGWDEDRFATALPSSAEDWSIENRTRSADHPLRHPLYRRYRDELDDRPGLEGAAHPDRYDPAAFTDDMDEELLAVMNDLLVDGTLQ